MKKTIIALSLLLPLSAVLHAQNIGREEFEQYMLLIKDLDEDHIRDSVYFDYENSVVVCRLSSRDFEPVKSRSIEHYVIVLDTESGFSLRYGSFLGGWTNKFRYEPETEKVRLIGMRRDVRVLGCQNGDSCIDLLTGEYTANWTFIDPSGDELEIPEIKTVLPFPDIYLEDFGEDISDGYSSKCSEVLDSYRKQNIE